MQPTLLIGLCLAASLLLPVTGAVAQEREVSLDHSGSVGVIANAGPEFSYAILAECLTCDRREALSALSLLFEIGATVAPWHEGDELLVRFRWMRLSRAVGEMAMVGYRSYFGSDELKTFVELDAQAAIRPQLAFGLRPALGVMYELSPLVGLSFEAGVSIGLASGLRVGFEALVGIQGRTYLLE